MNIAASVPADPDHASVEEVRHALGCLSAADAVRLRQIARLRATGLPGMEWADLLNEAIVRALDGQRQWPRDVALVAFLAQTMRSIASEARRSAVVEQPMADLTGSGELDDVALLDDLARHEVTPEREYAARQGLSRLDGLFAGDDVALAVLTATAQGQLPDAIKTHLGLTSTAYATVLKRVRRKLLAYGTERNGP